MTTATRFKNILAKQIEGIPALIGLPTSETTYLVSPVGGRPSEVYVRLYGDVNRVVVALNHNVSPYANLPVRVRVNTSGLYEVIGVDGLQAETFAGAATGSLNIPTMIGSLVATTWESSQFAPAKIRAANEGQDLFVYMNPAVYGSALIGNIYLDLSTAVASITTGQKALVAISVDTSANTLSATVGTSVAVTEPLHLAEAIAVTVPTGNVRLAAYVIQAGATTLPTTALTVDGNYYYDLRTWIAQPSTGGGGGGGTTLVDLRWDDFYPTVGTRGILDVAGQKFRGITYNASAANGDTLTTSTYLPAGDYTAEIITYKDTNLAIIDIKVNGAVVETLDLYAASQALNYQTTFTLSISSDGEQTIDLVVNGKNGSSSAYYLAITRLWIHS